MPLENSNKSRRLMHTRVVECEGFLRDDGLWEVEASLRDTKPFTQRADRFRLADGHGLVDREPQADIVHGIARLQFVAKTIGALREGLCIPQPRLDFPEPVVAQKALAFDRSRMHRPARFVAVFQRHQFIILHQSVTSGELDDHLAERRSRLHGLERLTEFLERHDLADHGLQFA